MFGPGYDGSRDERTQSESDALVSNGNGLEAPEFLYDGQLTGFNELHDDMMDRLDGSGSGSDEKSRSMEACDKYCCIFRPIVEFLLKSEQLHRSFCFGAIDGMLTGSGIVSAFCGLGVLNREATWEIRLAVVAFAASACVADSLCMAIGHVWTCYVVSSAQAQERSRERELMEKNRPYSKGKLVDMLLAKGMLKIDAMSLADTLEGYPEMFVGTLVGDPLLGGIEETIDDEEETSSHSLNGNRISRRNSSSSYVSRNGFFSTWRFPSYGQFNELEHDPDIGRVNEIFFDSQREGFVMMMGFAIFSIIPSLLWLFLPLVFDTPERAQQTEALNASNFSDDELVTPNYEVGYSNSEMNQTPTISLPSLVFTITAIIMWGLGVWKSTFLDSNWLVFGVETIVVLLTCCSSAYGMGSLMLFLLDGKQTIGTF